MSNRHQPQDSPFTKTARKAALEQAILPLKKDKKKAALLEKLNQLLAFNHQQNAEENKGEEKAVENFRRYLREEIPPAFHDQVFQLQLMLARHWPVNNLDEETHQPLDPHSLEMINDHDEVIPLSSGHLFLKRSLTQYYAQRHAYHGQSWRHPIVVNTHLSQREVDHLLRQNIIPPQRVARPENQIPVAPPLPHQYRNFGERFRDQPRDEPAEYFLIGFISRRYGYHPSAPRTATHNRFIDFMSKLGKGIGMLFSLILLGLMKGFAKNLSFILPLISAPATIGPIVFAVILSCGIINGITAARQGNSFWPGFIIGIITSTLLAALSLVGLGIVSILGGTAVISAATAASIGSILSYTLPALPALLLLGGIIGESIQPGFMNQLFMKVCCGMIIAPVVAFGALFGETARLLSRAAYAICDAFRLMRFQRAHQNHPPQAADPESRVRNELNANAQIHRDLGAEPAAPVPPSANQNPAPAHAGSRVIRSAPSPAFVLARNVFMREEREEQQARSVLSP